MFQANQASYSGRRTGTHLTPSTINASLTDFLAGRFECWTDATSDLSEPQTVKVRPEKEPATQTLLKCDRQPVEKITDPKLSEETLSHVTYLIYLFIYVFIYFYLVVTLK